MDYSEKIPPEGQSRIPGARLRKAMKPLFERFGQRLDKIEGQQVTREDMVEIAKTIIKNVEHNVTVEEKTVNNTVVQKAAIPPQIIDVLTILTEIVATPTPAQPLQMADYRPHDQEENGNKEWYGYVHPSGAWYIMYNQVDLDRQRYAAGTEGYEAAWESHRKLKYKFISEAFNEV